jgi:hypothetical protein
VSHLAQAAAGFVTLSGADAALAWSGLTIAIVPVLAAGIVVNVAAYVFGSVPNGWFGRPGVLAVLPFGAVLAGRLLAEPLARTRLKPALAAVLACYALAPGYGAAQPPPPRQQRAAGGQLAGGAPPAHRARHLYRVEPHHARQRRSCLGQDGVLAALGAVAHDYESEASWYDPRLSYAKFIVTDSAGSTSPSPIPRADILALAGPPAHTYQYKAFTIMV